MMAKQQTRTAQSSRVGRRTPLPANPLILALSAWDLITLRTYTCLEAATRWFAVGEGPGGVALEELRLGDFAGIPAGEMLRIPNFGRTCYYDLYAVMKLFGWSWGDHPRSRDEQQQNDLAVGLANHARLAQQRRDAFERGITLCDLRDREGLTCGIIASRVGLSQGFVQRKIAEVRKVQKLRSLYPLPAPAPSLHQV